MRLGWKRPDVAGRGSFRGELGWPGLVWQELGGRGRVSYGLGLSSAPQAANADHPLVLKGVAAVVFSGPTIRSSNGTATSRLGQVQYGGSVDLDGSYHLDLFVEAEDGGEWLGLAQRLWGGISEIEGLRGLNVDGPLKLQGTLAGQGSRFQWDGVTDIRSVLVRGQPVGDFRSPIVLSSRGIRLGGAQLSGTDHRLVATLDWPWQEPHRSLQLAFQKVPLDRVWALAGREPPVQGQASGQLELELQGNDRYWEGSGQVEVVRAEVLGQPIDHVLVPFRLSRSQLIADPVRIVSSQGTVTGKVDFHLDQRVYRLDLKGSGLDLENLQALQDSELSGAVDLGLRASGTLEGGGDFDLQLESARVRFCGYRLEDIRLGAKGDRDLARFQLTSRLQTNPVKVVGTLGLHSPYPVRAELKLAGFPLDPYFPSVLPAESSGVRGQVEGTITLEGALSAPSEVVLAGHFPRLILSMGEYRLNNDEPLSVTMKAGVVRLEPALLRGAETQLRVGGEIRLQEPRSTNLRLDGTVNLLVLNSLMAEGTTSGSLKISVVALGTLEKPRLVGTATLEEALLVYPSLPTPLYEGKGSFKFTANQISIDEFSARTAYGLRPGECGRRRVSGRPAAEAMAGQCVRLRLAIALSRGRLLRSGRGSGSDAQPPCPLDRWCRLCAFG